MSKLQLDAASWSTLSRLIDDALDQPLAERERWVEALSPEFDAHKPRLRALLARASVETSDLLDTMPKLPLGPGELTEDFASGESAGDQIGPYRLLREIGSGGMGTVWLAERVDGLMNRQVALKLPLGAWRRAGLAERMARERGILSSLAHPHIARLYDAGLTASGQPYLAIEYIEGTCIDLYCNERRLGVQQRLTLFTQVAGAVAYAHGKLVIHRDLKPANILVTPDSRAHLLDFGIAKLLDEGVASETALSEFAGRALTPDYASPEQILGEPLSVASDVYSLGVILYELLSGSRPYRLQRKSRGALEDAIVQAEPPLPSEVAGNPWSRSLRGDLDTIVLKALRKRPEDRYLTAHALLEDIERYRQGRPVLAQPDSRWYRVHKFIGRNKLAVSAAGAIAVALVAGASIATWQARVALAEKSRAEEVQQFIVEIFRETDPTQGKGKSLSAVELLQQAERRLRARTDVPMPQRIELLAIMGESLFGLQDNSESARVLTEALKLQESLPAGDPAMAARLNLALSEAQEYLGDEKGANASLAASLEALAAGNLQTTGLYVRAKLHAAALAFVATDYARSERECREAHAAAVASIGPRSPEAAVALLLLSKNYIFTNRAPLAVEQSRQALDIMLANYDGDYSHPRVIDAAQYYANALIHVGRFDQAAMQMRDLIARAGAVLGNDSRLVGELSSTAFPAALESGNLREAVELARHSVDIYLKEAQPETGLHAYRLRLLGHALVTARETREAIDRTAEALRLSMVANSGVAFARTGHGMALAHGGRFEEAEKELKLAIESSKAGSRPAQLALRNYGALLRLRGDHANAVEWLERGNTLAALDATNYIHRNDLAVGLVEAGLAQLELRQNEDARAAFERAETLFAETHHERMTPSRADLRVGMARLLMLEENARGALPGLLAAQTYWTESAPGSRWAGETELWLGRCYGKLGMETESSEALNRARTLLGASAFPGDARLARTARAGR